LQLLRIKWVQDPLTEKRELLSDGTSRGESTNAQPATEIKMHTSWLITAVAELLLRLIIYAYDCRVCP